MRNIEDTLVVTAGLVMGTAVGVLTAALGLGLMGLPWELHFSAHHVAAVAVGLTGVTVVTQGVVLVVDLLAGNSLGRATSELPIRTVLGNATATRARSVHRDSLDGARGDDRGPGGNVMGTQRVLSWLTVLIGLVLTATPWLLSFATDRVARLDVMIGGAVVALVGIALVYAVQPAATRRLSH